MKKIKTRYKILLLNILISGLYFFLMEIYFSAFRKSIDFIDLFQKLWDAYIFFICYNLIQIIWIGLIVFGAIRKKRELVFGGVYSLVLSLIIILSFILL